MIYINVNNTYLTITLFFMGPNIPGGSCFLSVQVIPLSYDCFMHPLHLQFIKWTVITDQNEITTTIFYHFGTQQWQVLRGIIIGEK